MLNKGELVKEIMYMTEQILNYLEIITLSQHQYDKLRSKVLRLSNNILRQISEEEKVVK
jgi:hypothetical protein